MRPSSGQERRRLPEVAVDLAIRDLRMTLRLRSSRYEIWRSSLTTAFALFGLWGLAAAAKPSFCAALVRTSRFPTPPHFLEFFPIPLGRSKRDEGREDGERIEFGDGFWGFKGDVAWDSLSP
ncbi:hypothetical protein B296_00059041 [Ensete ventricosum]|uniref:Uncharacterized protein n=1 Tax=Ensete ventricosum TaxID=4639 RepID=A0A426X8S9_ENSVE|nr:hypothetical protein B296_00059041 [Ensete ventricosum]